MQYFPSESKENAEFSRVVSQRPSGHYYPSPVLARRLGLSSLSLSRITSSLLVMLEDGSKTNIGLSLKFESKGLKVLGYSRRNDRGWEFSETTARAIAEYKAAFPAPFSNLDSQGGGEQLPLIDLIKVDIITSEELCPTSSEPDRIVRDMKKWLKEHNLLDLPAVSLFAEQLEKVSLNTSRS